jgi:hypothetical protein
MDPITISRGGKILAQHTTASPLSHYGQAVWVIEDSEPDPGPAVWQQGQNRIRMTIIEVRGGLLVCRQPGGLLCGIIWSDGGYYANLIETIDGRPCKSLYKRGGQRVRGTVQVNPGDPNDLGVVLVL